MDLNKLDIELIEIDTDEIIDSLAKDIEETIKNIMNN